MIKPVPCPECNKEPLVSEGDGYWSAVCQTLTPECSLAFLYQKDSSRDKIVETWNLMIKDWKK